MKHREPGGTARVGSGRSATGPRSSERPMPYPRHALPQRPRVLQGPDVTAPHAQWASARTQAAAPGIAGRYLEGALRKAGQVKAVEQLLVRHGAAVRLHLVGAHERGLPLEHEVAVAGPQQLGGSLLGRRAQALENCVTRAQLLALRSNRGPATRAAEGGHCHSCKPLAALGDPQRPPSKREGQSPPLEPPRLSSLPRWAACHTPGPLATSRPCPVLRRVSMLHATSLKKGRGEVFKCLSVS